MPRAPHRARRRFGQNFLVDRRAIERIVDALDLAQDTPVVEIGPGLGALTGRLIERSSRVAAIEIDRDLAARLAAEIDDGRVRWIVGDVLEQPWEAIHRAVDLGEHERLVVTGNLPYNISKPIVMKMLEPCAAVGRAVLMFQREVAERLTARIGSRDYGPLTVLSGAVFTVARSFDLPPSAFRPRPRVRSSVTVWTARSDRPSPELLERLRACLRVCFHARRRTMLNNVRHGLGETEIAAGARLATAGIDPSARAETVALPAFLRLCERWPADADTARP